ncbi:cell elongation-specific peptidoglycan biosynthesis regulator RodA [Jatrophihabitans endophyticus]|uniref:Cell elongation-specific peptidoglycan biosynthesis regulator RodA n=1 Tax=Jatrophihabitans endophyticus TaxID=1206085 RepID=A0A1M5I739_9ACTN|nr:FtsW/RodA/SpoVE family cell cycle protein [Jatrophihabitans endophyticus]SHG24081.1 cell elongation-specific peptidoglycan biosynthesis regulator RodA [Jatrophihabitans endophyticus]
MTGTLTPLQRIPTRRNVELMLLVFAVLIVVAAETAVEAAREGRLEPSRLLTYAAVPLALGLITHLVIRQVARYADPLMLPIVVLLNGLGLVMIHRLDLGRQEQSPSDFAAQAPKQVVWIALGLVLFLAILLVVRDHRALQRYAYTLALAGLFLLMLPVVLPAQFSEIPEAPGAHIWIRVAGFSIQPGEIAKILLTIFGAAYLVQKRDVLALAGRRVLGIDFPRGRDFGPLLLAWLVCIAILVRGSDLGTSLLFFGLFVVLLYVATERVSWVIVGVLLFAGGAYVAYQIFGKVQERVSVWLHPFSAANVSPGYDPTYQLRQSLFGLGTGGIFGTGLGSGHPELVPLPATDFIISSFGEETGLFGLIGLLTLYALLVARGFAAGLAVRDAFGKLLACGLAFLFALQLFVVVSGVTRLLPATGLTTPFLSYGGSSMLGSWAILALLVRVSDAARRPATTPPSPPPTTTAMQEAVPA